MKRSTFPVIAVVLLAVVLTAPQIVSARAGDDPYLLPPPSLERSEPVVCDGSRDIVLRHRYIRTDGHGVEVIGNCDVAILDSHIVAGRVGILVRSNSDVRIMNSFVQGSEGAVVVRGNADVVYAESTLRGGTRASGNSDLTDGGGITFGGVTIGAGGIQVKGTGEDGESGTIRVGVGGVEVRGTDEGGRSGSVKVGARGVQIREGEAAAVSGACRDLCESWSNSGLEEVACTVAVLEDRGYPVSDTAACEEVYIEYQCLRCASVLDLDDRDCAAVSKHCF